MNHDESRDSFRDAPDGPPTLGFPFVFTTPHPSPITPSSVNQQAAHIPIGRGGAVVGCVNRPGQWLIVPTSLKRGEGRLAV